MSELEDNPKPRKRRTPEELRVFYQEKMDGITQGEKREVIRLLSGVHDDLQKTTTYSCSKPIQEIGTAITHIKAALAKLGLK